MKEMNPIPIRFSDEDALEVRNGYLVDLYGKDFDEDQKWIQALPIGTYQHPLHGKIEVTAERVRRFAQNVKDKVRGTDLDIDYDHKARDGRAAGWVVDADARPDGLWLLVQWTEDALQALRKKEYRYFSPEFVDKWKHPKTGQMFKDVLFGGGLTNRPFLKDIMPINMSEVFNERGENRMDEFLNELRKALQLSEDASEADVAQALTGAAAGSSSESGGGGEEPKQASDAGTPGLDAIVKALTDAGSQKKEEEPPAEEHKELTETQAREIAMRLEDNPLVKQLREEVDQLRSQHRETQVAVKMDDWTVNGKYGLPAVVHEDVRVLLTEMDDRTAKKLSTILDKVTKSGLVELGEVGSERRRRFIQNGDYTHDPVKIFDERVSERMEQDSLDYVTAVEVCAAEDPRLFEEYRRESYLREDEEV